MTKDEQRKQILEMYNDAEKELFSMEVEERFLARKVLSVRAMQQPLGSLQATIKITKERVAFFKEMLTDKLYE